MTRTDLRRLARERAIVRDGVPAAMAFVAAAYGQGVNSVAATRTDDAGAGGVPLAADAGVPAAGVPLAAGETLEV